MAPPTFPVGPGPGQFATRNTLHSQTYFLSLFNRLLPGEYLDPIRVTPGGGYELFQAAAKAGERGSASASALENNNLIVFAADGALAVGGVEFYRSAATAGAMDVLVGTLVQCSKTKRLYRTTSIATFGALDLGPVTATVEAVGEGYEWNVAGPITALSGELLPGEVDTVFQVYTRVSETDLTFVFDPLLRVRQSVDIKDGADPALNALGNDRGIERRDGELEDQYRVRVRSPIDAVTIGAIRRVLTALLTDVAGYWAVIETFDVAFQTCWDAPNATYPFRPEYNPNLWAWDDPRPAPPWRGRWLGPQHYRAAVVIVIDYLPTIYDVGMAWDDPAMTPDEHRSRLGWRGYAAWDVPISFEFPFQAGFDGFDLAKQAVYAAAYAAVSQVKAAGINVSLELLSE